jgi:integrase
MAAEHADLAYCLAPTGVRIVFKPAADAAGLPWATPHKLRHGLASLMNEQGYTPAQIAAQLGHADGGVLALRTYVHAEGISEPAFIDEALSG